MKFGFLKTRLLLGALLCVLVQVPACAQLPKPQGQERPDIGVNLEGLSDWSRAKMFNDAMKTSRAWGKVDQPWVHEVKTDALGWPTEDAGVVVIADTPHIGGTYRLSFEGKADVSNVTDAKVEHLQYDAATKTGTADVVVPDSSTSLMLAFTHTDGGVRNVRLLRPGADAKSTFSKDFMEKLAPFSTLRFMDFLSTNGNPVQHWEERTTPAFASQAREQGGALEYVVQLANESDKDIWVNVPDQADENYVRQMALLLKNGLEKERKVYVEFSNEVWNWGFRQATRNLDAAKVEGKQVNSPLAFDGDTNEGYWAMRRIAKRSVEVGQIFQDVFGDKNFERVRPVYAAQVGYEEVYKQGLAFLENQYKEPKTVIYGLAGAPYFNLNDEENKRGDIKPEEILAALPQRIEETLQSAATMNVYARYYGLKSLAYEAGPHLHDPGGNGSTDAKIVANRDPRMGDLLEKYLRGWNAVGGDGLMYFSLSGGYSKWGSWGLVENMDESSPKYEAALRVVNSEKTPLTLGALPGSEIKAGDFWGSNRWDHRGVEVVGMEPGKWMQYAVRVPVPATYQLLVQVKGEGTAEVWVDGKKAGNLKVGNGGGNVLVPLVTGLNVLRIRGVEGRWELVGLKVVGTQV